MKHSWKRGSRMVSRAEECLTSRTLTGLPGSRALSLKLSPGGKAYNRTSGQWCGAAISYERPECVGV